MYAPGQSPATEDQARANASNFSEMAAMVYPSLPGRCLENLTVYAFSRGGVGWRDHLTLRERVNRAVAAHARHCHTRYDRLLRAPGAAGKIRMNAAITPERRRQEAWARNMVQPEVNRLLRTWASPGSQSLGARRA